MMKSLQRVLALVLCLTMLTVAVSGCGSVKTKDSDASFEYDPSEEVELTGTFELQIFTGGYSSEPWQEIIAAFEDEFPDLDVVAYMDANVNKKMQTRWMQGQPCDFLYVAGSNLPAQTYREEGKLLDLASFYDKATIYGTDELLKDHLNSNALHYYDTNLYEMPFTVEAYGVWYDESFLSKLGLSIPTNFEELLAFGSAAKQKGVNAIIYPGTSPMYLVHAFVFPALAVYGQEFLDSITTASDPDAFRDERFKEVLGRIDTMAKQGMFAEGTVALNHIQSQMQWLNNNACLIPNGLWLEGEMADDIPDGFKMRYAAPMMNKADEDQVIVTSVGSVAVATDGDNRAAALEFLRFMYKEENMAKFVKYWGVPVTTDADLSGVNLTETAQQAQSMLTDPSYTQVQLNFSWGSVDAVMIDVINQIVLQTMTIDEASETLATAAEEQLKK